MLEVLQQDYVRTARAKGVAERGVIYRHALRNAAIPVITVTGLSLGFMLSGAVIIETVFSWPGMGRLIVQAVPGRDFPVIQAGVFVFALIFVGINLIVDVLYTVVDPRGVRLPVIAASRGLRARDDWPRSCGLIVIAATVWRPLWRPSLAPADPVKNASSTV